MAKVLTATADPLKGSVIVSATAGVPSGQLTLTRAERGLVQVVRNGESAVSTAGFVREDPEPAFGVPLLYRATIAVDSTFIQSNRVLNPKAKTNTNNWTTGPNRTITQETRPEMAPSRDATTSLRVSAYPAGATTGTVADRMLAATAPSGLTTGRWFVTGQMRYDSPDLWLWEDVKAVGTWAQVKALGTWQQVKSKSSEAENAPYATLWGAIVGPTGTTLLTTPIQLLGVAADNGAQWRTFSAWMDVPAGVPAGSRVIFFHGTLSREYATDWWLSTVMVTPESEMGAGALLYMDGDTAVPANPAANLVPGYDWTPATADADFSWNGTDNNSVSVFNGPTIITTTTSLTLGRPAVADLPYQLPVHFADPVAPDMGQWFELLAIGELSWAARQDLYSILGKAAQVAVSQVRSWPSGELTLMTRTLEEAANAEQLFATGRILFWRNPDPRFPETSWYVAIGDTKAVRPSDAVAWAPERLWTVPWVKVERPSGLIAASGAVAA